jgi:hypothetical protein
MTNNKKLEERLDRLEKAVKLLHEHAINFKEMKDKVDYIYKHNDIEEWKDRVYKLENWKYRVCHEEEDD